MTRFEFYSKLNKFKDKNSLEHSFSKAVTNVANRAKTMANYGYYNKIDNYYGPGKTRYFYSKEEWDAYQNHKDALLQKAKDDVKYGKETKENQAKNANVTTAQKGREAAEKAGQKATQKEQNKQQREAMINTNKILDSFLDSIETYSTKYVGDKVKEVREKYKGKEWDYEKDPEWTKLYNAHVKNPKYNEDPELDNALYKMNQIEKEYTNKKAKEMAKDIKDILRNSNLTANNLYFIMKNPYVKEVLSGDTNALDQVKYLFQSLNADLAKTYDNSTTLYEDVLKENILKENELKEDIQKEKVLKEKKK